MSEEAARSEGRQVPVFSAPELMDSMSQRGGAAGGPRNSARSSMDSMSASSVSDGGCVIIMTGGVKARCLE